MAIVRRRLLQLAGAAVTWGRWQVSSHRRKPIHPSRADDCAVHGRGPSDVIPRIIVQKLPDHWRKQVYVENIPAGASNVGTAAAAKASPDGQTILVVSGSLVVNPSLYARVARDPIRDFAPVSLAAASSHVLAVHPSVPANTAKELAALVKANPGKYSYASPGAGTTGQLAGELFKLSLGLDLLHVPFNGATPALTSTIGGAHANSIRCIAGRDLKRQRWKAARSGRDWWRAFAGTPGCADHDRSRVPGSGIHLSAGHCGPGGNTQGHYRPMAPRNRPDCRAARCEGASGGDRIRAGCPTRRSSSAPG